MLAICSRDKSWQDLWCWCMPSFFGATVTTGRQWRLTTNKDLLLVRGAHPPDGAHGKGKVLFAEVFKLLVNSSYGKLIELLECQHIQRQEGVWWGFAERLFLQSWRNQPSMWPGKLEAQDHNQPALSVGDRCLLASKAADAQILLSGAVEPWCSSSSSVKAGE